MDIHSTEYNISLKGDLLQLLTRLMKIFTVSSQLFEQEDYHSLAKQIQK